MSHRTHLINTCEHIRPRGKSRGARKKELGSGEYLFWQADLLAEGLQPRIAANQIEFCIREVSTEPRGSKSSSHALQRIEGTLFVAQTGESQSLGKGALIPRRALLCPVAAPPRPPRGSHAADPLPH